LCLYEFRLYGELGQPQAEPPPAVAGGASGGTNVLAAKNGGEVILSPSEGWAHANDDKLDRTTWFYTGEEAVFGFKDGLPANMESFAVYLPAADGCNPKQIDLFAGDEGPTGAFSPLGSMTTVNGKLRDGWQRLKLPPTTARYLKVKLVSAQSGKEGNELCLYEFRLYGELGQSQAEPPAAGGSASGGTDVLAAKNGGEVILSPSEGWAHANDGKLDRVTWFYTGEEAVFGFKDEEPSEFDTLGVYLPAADGCNPKQIDLSTGDEGPTGAFTPLGSMTTVNGKLRDGWQELKLPPTTARYLKVKLVSAHSGKEGNELCLYELRLYGRPK